MSSLHELASAQLQTRITPEVVINYNDLLNTGSLDSKIVKPLLDRRGDQIHITEDVIKGCNKQLENWKRSDGTAAGQI
jgi:hypothetical protein